MSTEKFRITRAMCIITTEKNTKKSSTLKPPMYNVYITLKVIHKPSRSRDFVKNNSLSTVIRINNQ